MAIEDALKALEEKVEALAAAVEKNTQAHDNLAEVARAASGGAPAAEKPKAGSAKAADKKPAEDETSEAGDEKRAEKPKARQPRSKAKKPEKPEATTEIDLPTLKEKARVYMSGGDEAANEKAKEQVAAVFNHTGAKNLSGLSDTGRALLATSIDYWKAGLTPDFEAIEEEIGPSSDEEDGEDGDDMLS